MTCIGYRARMHPIAICLHSRIIRSNLNFFYKKIDNQSQRIENHWLRSLLYVDCSSTEMNMSIVLRLVRCIITL